MYLSVEIYANQAARSLPLIVSHCDDEVVNDKP